MFQLGTDLRTIAKQTGVKLQDVKIVHRSPVLIQEFEWRPEWSANNSSNGSTKDLVFSFHEGKLFHVAIKYDVRDTEGLRAEDMVQAISRTYGNPTQATEGSQVRQGRYSDEEQVLARWEDSNHHFNLVRSSYGGRYSLVGVLKGLEVPVEKAVPEARRLDIAEAPERELERIAAQADTDRANLEKARLANKPKFRP